jgi:hypothetical protein
MLEENVPEKTPIADFNTEADGTFITLNTKGMISKVSKRGDKK